MNSNLHWMANFTERFVSEHEIDDPYRAKPYSQINRVALAGVLSEQLIALDIPHQLELWLWERDSGNHPIPLLCRHYVLKLNGERLTFLEQGHGFDSTLNQLVDKGALHGQQVEVITPLDMRYLRDKGAFSTHYQPQFGEMFNQAWWMYQRDLLTMCLPTSQAPDKLKPKL